MIACSLPVALTDTQEDAMHYSVDTFRIKTLAAVVIATAITLLFAVSTLIG